MAAYATSKQTSETEWKQPLIEAAVAGQNPNIRDLFERFLPEHRRTQTLGESIDPHLVLDHKGNVERGRQLFFGSASQCKNCHRIGKEGGNLGPDLSEVAKKNKPEDILDSLINPSRKVDPKFAAQMIVTTEGKVLTGIVIEKTVAETVINVQQGSEIKTLRLAATEIDEVTPQTKSLMPERLLRDFTAQQAADLVEFLSSLKANSQ
ncbi:MAG: c-type cytochrome [Planctomycetes bacterium]|nr:c-type cytochrome [Planctomycetota bacterium]